MTETTDMPAQKKERGQSLTEFAISLTFMIVLLAGMIDLSRAFFAYIIVRDAAQEGAIYGAITSKNDITDFKNRVSKRVISAFTDPSSPSTPPVDLNDLNVTTEIIGSPCVGTGNSIRVTVDYKLPVTMPFLGAIIGSQEINMSTSVEDTIIAPMCP